MTECIRLSNIYCKMLWQQDIDITKPITRSTGGNLKGAFSYIIITCTYVREYERWRYFIKTKTSCSKLFLLFWEKSENCPWWIFLKIQHFLFLFEQLHSFWERKGICKIDWCVLCKCMISWLNPTKYKIFNIHLIQNSLCFRLILKCLISAQLPASLLEFKEHF